MANPTPTPAPANAWASLVAQPVKNPPAMWEIWVQSLDWEDPLEKGAPTYSSILAWRIPWTIQFMGLQRVAYDFDFSLSFSCIAGRFFTD